MLPGSTESDYDIILKHMYELPACITIFPQILWVPPYCVSIRKTFHQTSFNVSLDITVERKVKPLNPELNPICYLLALLGAPHFLHVSRIRVKSLTLKLLMFYIYIWSTHS